MSPGQYATLEKLISQFEQVMVSLKLQDQWFHGAGSLLGSLQHHDLIPWDDDADVCAHLRYRQRIQQALKNLWPKFGTEIDSAMGEEFLQSYRKFSLGHIYPLTYRPFGKHWYPAPRRPISFLKTFYSTNKQYYSSHSYSHALEKVIVAKYMDCGRLAERYAFVHRCPIPEEERGNTPLGFCDEHLVDGSGRSVHKIRTVLDPEEMTIPLFTVRHELFKCPREILCKAIY
uniref:Lipopolysaccharide choline n=1 Tax=Echinococcus granulosus TaxID=6210 RepID=A0A068WUQ2_ECHGR|nr:lipopolysaccharide choline [Echinococcus granulosus]